MITLDPKQILNLKTIRDIAKHYPWPDMDTLIEAIEEDVRETLIDPRHNKIAHQTCMEYVQELIAMYNKYHPNQLVLQTKNLFTCKLKMINDTNVLSYSSTFTIPK